MGYVGSIFQWYACCIFGTPFARQSLSGWVTTSKSIEDEYESDVIEFVIAAEVFTRLDTNHASLPRRFCIMIHLYSATLALEAMIHPAGDGGEEEKRKRGRGERESDQGIYPVHLSYLHF